MRKKCKIDDFDVLAERVRGNSELTKSMFDQLALRMEERFTACQAAITKAETAAEKRFESVNEFRGQMADQATHFITRNESELKDKGQRDISDSLRKDLTTIKDDFQKDIVSLRTTDSDRSGSSRGMRDMYGWVFGIAVLAISIVSLYIKSVGH